MGYVQFDADWRLGDCRVLTLESDRLRLNVLPELGGKIYHWIHKPEDRDILWQHPRIRPRLLPAGLGYDDLWSGGWDELFPSDAPIQHAGEFLPDHGEYWTRSFAWDVAQTASTLTLHLSALGSVTPTRMERWIVLEAGSPIVRIRYRLTQLGEHGFDFLWKLHPALRVVPGCRFLIPGTTGIVSSPGSGRFAAGASAFTWPQVPGKDGRDVDFSAVPETSGTAGYESVTVTALDDGWCALFDPQTGSGFGLGFDPKLFSNVYLFATYGSWRGLHTAVLEPCTPYGFDTPANAKTGISLRLERGQTIETELVAVVFTQQRAIRSIGRDGLIAPE